VIGNTGTGKSTLINSLLVTPDGMERVRENIDGEFGRQFRWNIRPKNYIKDVDGSLELFRVSSDPAKSCTSYGEILIREGVAYCDCPGFGDTSGLEQDLVTCLSIGSLLRSAERVRLLATISY
jgi:hypothetical protein